MKKGFWVHYLIAATSMLILSACGGGSTGDNTSSVTEKETTVLPFDLEKIEGYQKGIPSEKLIGEITNQYWVEPNYSIEEAQLREIIEEHYPEFHIVGFSDTYGLLVENNDTSKYTETLIEKLSLEKGVLSVRKRVYVGMDYIKQNAFTLPNDGGSAINDSEGDNWHLGYMHMPEAWEITTGSDKVNIGVIEFGFSCDHVELKNRYTGVCTKSGDVHHGTAVTSIIGAESNNGVGVTGLNWLSRMKLQTLTKKDDFASPYNKVFTDNSVLLVNTSLGWAYWENKKYKKSYDNAYKFSRPLEKVIKKYPNKLFIFAAGNDFMDTAFDVNGGLYLKKSQSGAYEIAKLDNVLIVAAVLKDGILPAYSNYGKTVDIAAPTAVKAAKEHVSNQTDTYFELSSNDSPYYGTDDVRSYTRKVDVNNYHQASFDGTSAAAPMVTGVASLIYSLNPSFTPKEVKEILLESSGIKAEARYRCAAYNSNTCQKEFGGIPGGNIPIIDAGAALTLAKEIVDGKKLLVKQYHPSVFSSQHAVVLYSKSNSVTIEGMDISVNGDRTTRENTSQIGREYWFDMNNNYATFDIKGKAYISGVKLAEGVTEVKIEESIPNNILPLQLKVKNSEGDILNDVTLTVENLAYSVETIKELMDLKLTSIDNIKNFIFQYKKLASGNTMLFLNNASDYKLYISKSGYQMAVKKISPQDGFVEVILEKEEKLSAIITIENSQQLLEGTPVTFDASQSFIPEGDIVSYEWKVDGQVVSNTATLTITFDAVGDHIITLTVTDSQGNRSTVEKTVHIGDMTSVDTEAPRIILNGSNPTIITLGETYRDEGAMAVDNIDDMVDVRIVSNNVNTNVVGTYQVVYEAIDSANNRSTVTREVHVVDTTDVDLVSGLIVHYEFEDVNDLGKDSSGNGNHGILNGNIVAVDGIVGQAALLGTVNDYIQISQSIKLQDFTFSYFINIQERAENYNQTNGATNSFFSAANSSEDNLIKCEWTNQSNGILYGYNRENRDFGNYNLLDRWTFVTYTFQNGTGILYVNGKPADNYVFSSEIEMEIESLIIGKEQDCNGGCFEDGQSLLGKVDDFRIYNRALDEEEVKYLYDVSLNWALDRDLLAYYEFEGDVTDSSGNGNHATAYGSVSYVDGITGQAVKLDGNDDKVILGEALLPTETNGSMTISMDIVFDDFDRQEVIISQYDSGVGRFHLKKTSDNNLVLFMAGSDSSQNKSITYALTDNRLMHINIVKNMSEVSLYVNAEKINSFTIDVGIANTDTVLGWDSNSYDNNFKGSVDNLRIYSRALSESEIQDLYGMSNQ